VAPKSIQNHSKSMFRTVVRTVRECAPTHAVTGQRSASQLPSLARPYPCASTGWVLDLKPGAEDYGCLRSALLVTVTTDSGVIRRQNRRLWSAAGHAPATTPPLVTISVTMERTRKTPATATNGPPRLQAHLTPNTAVQLDQ
jgi:hypothetical protein